MALPSSLSRRSALVWSASAFLGWLFSLTALCLLIRGAHGYTVRECAAAGAGCCQGPPPAQHWAAAHCGALAADARETWPAPFSSCQVTVVSTCYDAAGNVPVVYTAQDLAVEIRNGTHLREDAYHMLAREYAAALLNTAPRLDPRLCVDAASVRARVAMPTAQRDQEVALKADVMDRAGVLLTLHCAARSFGAIATASERQEIGWLTSLLHGFNTGTMFTGSSPCAAGGDPTAAYGSDAVGPDVRCVSSPNREACTLSPREWLDLSCSRRVPGRGDTTQCPRWPAIRSGTREDTFLCGEHETYVEVLRNASSRGTGDAWVQLAGETVAARLNGAAGACQTGSVRDALDRATLLLRRDCPCSDPQLLGQVGCTHDAAAVHAAEYGPLIAELAEYNSGVTGPGSCADRAVARAAEEPPQPPPETAIEDKGFCCVGGCTRGYAHFLSHSCHSWQLGSSHRQAWPGAEDDRCATVPNAEDDTSLCGKPRYDILRAYTTELGVDEQDAWSMLAQAVVVAQLNQDGGACTEHAVTRYARLDEPWYRLTVAELIAHATRTLTAHCDQVGSVRYTSALGAEMHAMRIALDDFIRGAYGPGRCFPDAAGSKLISSTCNAVDLDATEPRALSSWALPATVNDGARDPVRCELDGDPACCTLTAHYWTRHNAEEEPPRDAEPWPLVLPHVTCDYVNDECAQDGDLESNRLARALAQAWRVNPLRVAPGAIGADAAGAPRRLQEATAFCSANVSGTYTNFRRALDTQMAALLRLGRSAAGLARLTQGQRQWVRLANAFSAALLNVWRMVDRRCHDSSDAVLRHVGSFELADHRYMLETDFLDRCLFGACDAAHSGMDDPIPTLPRTALCASGFFSVVNALEAFSNGFVERGHDMAYHTEHGHCYAQEPAATQCAIGTDDRYCACALDRLHYQTHYQGNAHASLQQPWPRVSTSAQDLLVPFPRDVLLSENLDPDAPPAHTEDFTALMCPTKPGADPVTWFDVLMEAPPDGREDDAYSQLMTQLIPAWLNMFRGACAPSDVVQTLLEATHLVDAMVRSPDNVLCASSHLGTRVPVDPASSRGVIMVSAERVLRSFNEGLQGSDACIDLCVGADAPACGDHGACQPLTGRCACDEGYVGETCAYSDCSGHGVQLTAGRSCTCFPGWGGATCNTCAGPNTAQGHVYLCMPCDEDVCGAAGQYLLHNVHASNATKMLTGEHKHRGYDKLPLPLRPGTSGLDCSCGSLDQVVAGVSSLIASGGGGGTPPSSRVPKSATTLAARYKQRVASTFFSIRKGRGQQRDERARVRASVVNHLNTEIASAPRDPRAWNLPVDDRRGVVTQRDLCDTESEETTIEDFLLLCMEDLTNLQTALEETTTMCEASIDQCESAIEENTAVTHVDLFDQAESDNNEQRNLTISTLAVASAGVFLLVIFMIILLLVWTGVRLRRPAPGARASMYGGGKRGTIAPGYGSGGHRM